MALEASSALGFGACGVLARAQEFLRERYEARGRSAGGNAAAGDGDLWRRIYRPLLKMQQTGEHGGRQRLPVVAWAPRPTGATREAWACPPPGAG